MTLTQYFCVAGVAHFVTSILFFFVAGMVPILAPFLALVAHTLADSFNHVLHVLVGLVTR